VKKERPVVLVKGSLRLLPMEEMGDFTCRLMTSTSEQQP
jgi:hypothetical protein